MKKLILTLSLFFVITFCVQKIAFSQPLNSLTISFNQIFPMNSNGFPDSFGFGIEYQRSLGNLHLFGRMSEYSSLNKTNNPQNLDEALNGFLRTSLTIAAGAEFYLLNTNKSKLGFGLGPAIRLRKEVEPIEAYKFTYPGGTHEFISVKNEYVKKVEGGIVFFMSYRYLIKSPFYLGLQPTVEQFSEHDGVFLLSILSGFNF